MERRGRIRGHLLHCDACAHAFADILDAAITPEEAARYHEQLPFPPAVAAALEAQKQQQENAERLREALTAVLVVIWGKAQMHKMRRRAIAAGRRGSEEADPLWPQQVELAVLDDVGQETGRSLLCTVLHPPLITTTGEFRCLVRAADPALVGWSVRCTVATLANMGVTFGGTFQLTADGRGALAWLSASGLRAPADQKNPVLIPAAQIRWQVQPTSSRSLPTKSVAPVSDWMLLLGLASDPLETTGVQVWVQPAVSPVDRGQENAAQSFAVDAGTRFGLLADHDVFVSLFHVDLFGEVTRLLPGVLSVEQRFRAGHTRFLPEQINEEWTVSGPPGFDTVIAVATVQPLDTAGDLAALARMLAHLPPTQRSVGYWQFVVI